MPSIRQVTVWSEFRHEKEDPKIAAIYPDGMHEAIWVLEHSPHFTWPSIPGHCTL